MTPQSGARTSDVVDVAVVGAGVVGTAIARATALAGASVALIDTAADVGARTSKANTAILHTGFDAKPGTLEARLVARGYALLGAYAAAAGIAVERTGALLVAWDDEQVARLPAIAEQAAANGYDSTRPIALDELARLEPHLGPGAVAALEVPGEAIIDPWSPAIAFATEAVGAGSGLHLRTEVTGAEVGAETTVLATSGGPVEARIVINAAGLGADHLDRAFGHEDFTVTPRRGELLVFDKLARGLVSHVLLPVPTTTTKGVLVAPTVFGNVLLGPTAEDLQDRTDTSSSQRGIDGLLAHGRRILPTLLGHEVTAVYAGLRAATEHADYRIRARPDQRYITVGGIRSTGLTASLAIAEHVLGLLAELGLDHLEGARATVPGTPPAMPMLGEAFLRPHRDPVAIAADPAYGQVVCHCERVTAGELRDAVRSALPATDIDGLRRRTRAGTGRCQQFFCAGGLAVTLRDRQAPPGPTSPTAPPGTAEVVVIGAGPAGLALAEALARRGAEVVVLDREPEPGGIPRLCHHRSFGLDLRRPLRGPDYARRRVDRALAAGASILPGVSVTGWDGDALTYSAPAGLGSLTGRAVVLATGCRERPRSARLVPGDRPAGVMTTGQLQQLVAVGAPIGKRAVVVGAEHVSYSAALTLRDAGAEVIMTTPAARHETFAAFALGMRVLRVPLLSDTTVTRIFGRSRVEGVELGDGSIVGCDAVVFTGDWRADDELARMRSIDLAPGGATSKPGVFAVGNVRLLGRRADQCVRDAEDAVDLVTAWLERG